MQIIRPVDITDGKLITSNVPEFDYSAWDAATAYAIGDRVQYVAAGIHNIYEAVATSTGEDPYYGTADPAKWALVASTNKWRLFDGGVSTQTVNPATIDVTVAPGEPIDSIALINTDATSVAITITDPTAGVVYDTTSSPTSLVDPMGIDDWYAYFYEPTGRRSDTIISNLPRYQGATIRVLISSPDYAKCGELVLGRSREIGNAQYGASVGIQDYSVKTVNDWGDYTIVQRPFQKRADFNVWCANGTIDSLQQLLATYRATPVVYVGSTLYGATILFGFYKNFAIEIAYPTVSICTLTIEGLT
jgi:hypothetical protein